MRTILRSSELGPSVARQGRHPALWAFLVCASCGGAATDTHAQGPVLWPYGGDAMKIFDDAIELTAVGYGADVDRGAEPAQDKRLRERTQIADAVLRVRVTGVTSKNNDGANGWEIACHTLDVLAGKRPPPPDFTLHVDAAGPAAGILRQFAGRVAAGTFVVFVEEFARSDGAAGGQLHFHVAKDAPEELIAIREAATSGDAR